MKSLLILLALALLASSCAVRTLTPIDPMTMRPSERCNPHRDAEGYPVEATK